MPVDILIGQPIQQEIGGDTTKLMRGLADHGEPRFENFRDVEVVKSSKRQIAGNADAAIEQRLQGIASGEAVGGKNCGRWVRSTNCIEQNGRRSILRRALENWEGLESCLLHRFVVTLEARAECVEVVVESSDCNAFVAMSRDQMLDSASSAAAVLDEHRTIAAIG